MHVYGSGSAEEKEKINAMAKGYSNIHIMGFADDKDLPTIFGKCIAAIGINPDEDLLMGIMEAMASGKPGISINPDKNCTERVLLQKTGILIKDESDLCDAVKMLNSKMAHEMRFACKERSKLFSSDNYINTILSKLENQKNLNGVHLASTEIQKV